MCQNEARFVPPRHLLGGTTRSMMTLVIYARTSANWLPRFNFSTSHTILSICYHANKLHIESFTMDVMCMDKQSNMFMWQEFHPNDVICMGEEVTCSRRELNVENFIVRCAGLMWSFLLIGHLCLRGIW